VCRRANDKRDQIELRMGVQIVEALDETAGVPEGYEAFLNFKPHTVTDYYITSEADMRVIIKGNQGGGTACAMYDAAMRVLGIHPIAKRNILNKPIRFVSKVKPADKDDEENQQYVEFKRLIPDYLIEKDVTARSSQMIIRRPDTTKIKAEFMSSQQDHDAFMSVQRAALYQDEEIDKIKWDENQMRLLREKKEGSGDTTVSLTPARGLDWTYDAIWCRARKIYRSKTICDKFGFKEIEENANVKTDIEIFCWATDDNPIMDQNSIDILFRDCIDPDDIAMRRYGVFKQASGKIFKTFSRQTHVLPENTVFDPEIFKAYWHFRIIDYHPSKPWYISWVTITPRQEWFVWQELVASHDTCTSFDLRDKIKSMSLVEEDSMLNRATLIDPLSEVKQANTGMSVYDDLRLGEDSLHRLTPSDTKNTSARDKVKVRLQNALRCEVPGNNINKKEAYDNRYGVYLPTLWFLDSCPVHIEHFDKWRLVDFKQEHVKAVRTVKRPSEKWSDFCRNIEFLAALDPIWYPMPEEIDDYYEGTGRFRGGRV